MGKVSDALGKTKVFFKKNAPTIYMCASGSLVILGGATLCLFAPEIAGVTKKLQEMAKNGASKKDIAIAAIKGYVKYAGIGFACQIAGIIFACKSKMELENRLASVSAALASTMASYAAYRQRVKNDVGEDKDFYYYTGEKVTTQTVVNDDGSVQEAKTYIPSPELAQELKDGTRVIPHTFVFDETNPWHHGNTEADINFLYNSLAAANRTLKFQGYIFDNDIFKIFGTKRTKEGQSNGAMKDWPDGTVEHKLRLNPIWLQPFLNGQQNWCVCEIQYDDGSPLGNILQYAEMYL